MYDKKGNIIYEAYTNDEKEGNGKYINEDGTYYIGQFKNYLPNGKGIEYYKNRSIRYEGDFIDGKYEGNGKFINEDGIYYIGQFKNGLKNGKGKLCLKNGIIFYRGTFINDKVTLNCVIN